MAEVLLRAFYSNLYEVHLVPEEMETTFVLRTVHRGIEVKRGSLDKVFTEAKRRGVRVFDFRYEDWIIDDSEIYAEYKAILEAV